MLVSKWLVERLLGQSEKYNDINVKQIEKSLSIALEAKQEQLEEIIQSKDEQIAFLKQHIAAINELAEHERARADGAIDNLLTQNRMAAVANADLAREATAKAVERQSEEKDKAAVMKELFESVNMSMQDTEAA